MTKARDLSAFVSQGVSTTELGYLDGVTSAVQTQLNQKPEFTAGKNRAINGDFAINQRAFTTTSSDNIFFADRWLTTMFSGTVTFANTSIAYNSFPGQVSNRALRITSSSSTNDAGIRHKIEDVTTFAGQTITISCWIRSSGTTYNIDLVEALQVFAGSANVYTYADVSGKTYNNNWTRLSFQVAIPSAAGKTIGSGNHLSIRIDPANGIANGDWIEITHLQIEAGSVATPFTLAGGGNPQAELALCQRYYETGVTHCRAFGNIGSNYPIAAGTGAVFAVVKRATPTITYGSPTLNQNVYTNTGNTDNINTGSFNPIFLRANGGTADYMQGTYPWTASIEL